MAPTEARITVRNVTMAYGDFVIQRDLNFSVNSGEVFIIMGGSGCGKSTVLRALTGLKAPSRGDVLYDGVNFWESDPLQRDRMMRRFGILYQSGALWSSMTLAENVGLPLGEYTDLRPGEIREVASLKLALVGLAGFEDYYPSEISGGMRKRAGVARALALDPDILIADEPTTALDVTVQAQIMDLLARLQRDTGMGLILITHDLGVVAGVADRVAVMYAGRIVETGPVRDLYRRPAHPYTKGLMASIPRLDQRGGPLTPITGAPPDLTAIPSGCPFHPRCPYRRDVCVQDRPPLFDAGRDRGSACHFWEEVADGEHPG